MQTETNPQLVFGETSTPCTQADGNGNVVTVNKSGDARKVEKIHRKAGLELGLFSQLVIPPLTVKRVKEVGTLGTTSLAWYIGRAVYLAKQEKTSIMKAIVRIRHSSLRRVTLTVTTDRSQPLWSRPVHRQDHLRSALCVRRWLYRGSCAPEADRRRGAGIRR
jgi:hypothetical protein